MRDSVIAFLALIVVLTAASHLPIELTIGIAVAALAFIAVEAFGDGDDWRRVVRLLENSPQSLYKSLLGKVLDYFDGALTPEAVARRDPPTALSRAFGWRLYDRCLLLALLYPLIFVFVQWGVGEAGAPGRIGDFDVLPAEMSRFGRIATLTALALLTAYFLCQKYLMARLQSIFESFGAGPSLSEILAFLVWLLGALGGAVAFAFAGAFTFAVALGGAGAVAGAFAGAVAGAVAVMEGFERIHKRRPVLAYILLIGIAVAGYAATLIYGDFSNDLARTTILFLGLLTLVNAQFDFLSIAATRHMLRRGLESGQLRHGVGDAAIGGIVFVLLCFTATAVAVLANRLSGDTLIDLAAVFRAPQDHLWLFAAFLTTLLPTFLHGVLAVFSIALTAPVPICRWCAEKIRAHHEDGASLADIRLAHISIALTAGVATMLCALVARLLWIAVQDIGHLGTFLLDACEGLARMLGGL